MVLYRHACRALSSALTTAALMMGCQVFAQQIAAPAADPSCIEFLKGSAAHLAHVAEQKRGSYEAKRPRFVTLKEDQEIAKQWKGEISPAVIQAYLPEGVTAIDHELKGNEAPGIVKMMQQSGEYLALRVEMEWQGEMTSTNVVVSAFALAENLKRRLAGEKIYLIGPSSSASLFWGHGGGTNSSSASTVDTIMNSMSGNNIASLGFDHPLHGEGSRYVFKDNDDFLRWQVALRNKLIHPDVPVIKIGHSMGGEDADMAFRRFDRPDLGLSDAFRGYIPLSFVPDPAPGAPYEDRLKAEEKIAAYQQREDVIPLIAPGDRDLGRTLTKAGKTSIMCELQCLFLARENDWTIRPNPAVTYRHTGKPIRALYIMGEHDALVRGFDEPMTKHLLTVPNVDLVTMGVRVSRSGEVMAVGHMIFDHLQPVEHSEEADRAIRQWMEMKNPENASKSQEELAAMFKDQMVKPFALSYSFQTKANSFPSALLMAAYYYNADFKAFLDRQIDVTADRSRVGSVDEDGDAFTEEMAIDAAHRKYFLQFGVSDKKRDSYETMELIRDFVLNILKEDGVNVANLKAPAASTELKFLKFWFNTFLMREYLPDFYVHKPIPNEDFVKLQQAATRMEQYQRRMGNIQKDKKKTDEQKAKDIAALEAPLGLNGQPASAEQAEAIIQISNEIRSRKNITPPKELEEIHHRMKQLAAETDALTKNMRRWESKLKRILSADQPAEIASLERDLTLQEDRLNDDRVRVSQVMGDRVNESRQRGLNFAQAVEDLDQDIWNMAVFWHEEANQYAAASAHLEKSKVSAALNGVFGPRAQHFAQQLHGADGALAQLSRSQAEMETLVHRVRTINATLEQELKAAFAQKPLSDYFRYESSSIWESLHDLPSLQDTAKMKELSDHLSKLLLSFNTEIWGHRPPPAKTTLY